MPDVRQQDLMMDESLGWLVCTNKILQLSAAGRLMQVDVYNGYEMLAVDGGGDVVFCACSALICAAL